jgi:hypothetical protein
VASCWNLILALAPSLAPMVAWVAPPTKAYPIIRAQINFKCNFATCINKEHTCPSDYPIVVSHLPNLEVGGSNPPEAEQTFLPSQPWPNSGCHMAPSDWAMCHLVIGSYY